MITGIAATVANTDAQSSATVLLTAAANDDLVILSLNEMAHNRSGFLTLSRDAARVLALSLIDLVGFGDAPESE